ncbi:hypothetical protein F441_11936 [Phytophthora nicotianae CJ01A1]|uniref:Uncharacterized protein n=2 Tax=Phytophthora nicotianae TaxID=4792 RepID=W2WR12_PHYNI|nr:hypothetical protein F444_12074 [Phytophthora nicotianae P1976]ETP12732.1 hypothetical protein F441_11936 [Phytophthora nicotianae CJ01A1]
MEEQAIRSKDDVFSCTCTAKVRSSPKAALGWQSWDMVFHGTVRGEAAKQK